MYKHYIRYDKNGFVVHAFSDKFETPLETDALLHESESMHFMHGGKVNPKILHIDGCPMYKGLMELVTEEDISRWKLKKETSLEGLRLKRTNEFLLIDKYQLALVYAGLSDSQKQELSDYRLAWLDVTETKVVPTRPTWLV